MLMFEREPESNVMALVKVLHMCQNRPAYNAAMCARMCLGVNGEGTCICKSI